MNVLAHRALLADHERSRRARFREVLLRERPGIEVGEAGELEELVRTLERAVFGLTRVRHPPGADADEPAGLEDRSPKPARPRAAVQVALAGMRRA